jgi:hypothetical protein
MHRRSSHRLLALRRRRLAEAKQADRERSERASERSSGRAKRGPLLTGGRGAGRSAICGLEALACVWFTAPIFQRMPTRGGFGGAEPPRRRRQAWHSITPEAHQASLASANYGRIYLHLGKWARRS